MASKIVQPDFFSSHQEEQFNEFKKNAERTFRGLFARYTDLFVRIEEIHTRLDRICEDLYRNG